MRWRLLVTLCLSLLTACAKKPTPAGLALADFLDQISQGNHTGLQGSLARGSFMVDKLNGTELTEGRVEVLARFNIGVHSWSKTHLVNEVVLPNGDHHLEMLLDQCLKAENQAVCTRPNVYRWIADVRNEDGAWKIASSTCSEKDIIR